MVAMFSIDSKTILLHGNENVSRIDIKSSNKSKDLFDHMSEFESQIGLAKGFYKRLLKEDDWSFVIKLSALIEASCTFAICAALDRPELEDAISHIELANLRYGKLPMLLKLNALEKDQVGIIRDLAGRGKRGWSGRRGRDSITCG